MNAEEDVSELGQMLLGNPGADVSCPGFVEAGMRQLALEIERVEWNRTQKQYEAPTRNNGEHYETSVFEMHAYYWGEEQCLIERPNFRCGDFEVYWYKYCGRGMSMNRQIDANEFFIMLDRCLASVRE